MTHTHFYLKPAVALATLALLLGASELLAQDQPKSPSDVVYDHQAPGMTSPKPLYTQAEAEYAPGPRLRKIQGNVFLSLIVNADGTVRDPKVTQSLDKDLDKKALECVAKWKFEPATKDGKPVAMRVAVEVNFHLY